ncbi:hypothetical protein CH63R_03356 [Colletotrichum higginsianum IMI 349063]|uniref:Fungal N-terminal domain-containing protein n=1 Tax=Colletotrichum higginsianum (strain IMI 349063) TaxID=759273 RepID=A0A1B7YRF2_COLHI|nr:hypothetical protein CH63R_03356 [Colletotrichum higginsianum IMI 349063]OBR14630.1 hypothetical protein CH63R_03356 [Colletotrichum higginsianum IMI 349063]
MAEIVGIVASAAALVQLVRYGKKSAHALYQFSHHAGVSQIDVERCANQIQSFSLIVGSARQSLDQHREDCTGSAVLDFISAHRVFDAITIDAKSVKIRLKLAARQFSSLAKGKRTLPAFINWWLHKDAVVSLFPEMERIKTNLMLIILVIQLELQMKEIKVRPPTSPEIKTLENNV